MKHLQGILAIPTSNLYAFTDSTIVLYWIYGKSQRFKTFEANRIGEIQENVPPEKWAHVISEENPADVGSRGITPGEITDRSLWCRVRTGPGKPGKAWNFIMAFSRTGKSWKKATGPGKFWKFVKLS